MPNTVNRSSATSYGVELFAKVESSAVWLHSIHTTIIDLVTVFRACDGIVSLGVG
jgi:hypothetical protein